MASTFTYSLPTSHLIPKERLPEGKTPCVIATCGSYNPITTAHVDMFETAKQQLTDRIESDPLCQHLAFAGAFLSPVNDAYKKPGLGSFEHRWKIAELVLRDHPWLQVDPWEGLQHEYCRSYVVLSHIRKECEAFYGVDKVEVFFLCGADLFDTFYKPGCWLLSLLQKIFDEFSLIVVARAGSESPIHMMETRREPLSNEKEPGITLDLTKYIHKVSVIEMLDGEVSSTMVRNKVKAGESVEGLLPSAAVAYIAEKKLYLE